MATTSNSFKGKISTPSAQSLKISSPSKAGSAVGNSAIGSLVGSAAQGIAASKAATSSLAGKTVGQAVSKSTASKGKQTGSAGLANVAGKQAGTAGLANAMGAAAADNLYGNLLGTAGVANAVGTLGMQQNPAATSLTPSNVVAASGNVNQPVGGVGTIGSSTKGTATPTTGLTTGTLNIPNAESLYQQSVNKQIADAYKQQIDYLNKQSAGLQKQLPDILTSVGSPFEQQLPLLEQQLQAQQQAGATQAENLKLQEQQGLSQTRRSAAEQIQRAQQQFGGVGGSSAAEAAGTIIGQEQLRSQGNIMQQVAQQQQNIQNQLRTIQSDYNANVAKLQLQKEQALSQARLDFNKQLREIETAKLSAGQTKTSQTLQALQDFATRRRQLEDSATAYMRQLEYARMTAAMAANQANLANTIISPLDLTTFKNPSERGKVISTVVANTGDDPKLLASYGLRKLPGVGGGQDLYIDQNGNTYNLYGTQYK